MPAGAWTTNTAKPPVPTATSYVPPADAVEVQLLVGRAVRTSINL